MTAARKKPAPLDWRPEWDTLLDEVVAAAPPLGQEQQEVIRSAFAGRRDEGGPR